MRVWGIVAAFAVLLALPACAHAPAANDARTQRVVARVMVAALADPSPEGRRWDALSMRLSPYMHWHAAEPTDGAPGALTKRTGSIGGQGGRVGVRAEGPDERVMLLTFDVEGFTTLALLEALRAEGAEVSFQADYESYSEYVVSAPGREAALLTSASTCNPLENRPAIECSETATLAFEAF